MMYATDLIALRNAWYAADEAWSTEYTKLCGPREWPGDVRYTARAKGEAGSPCRAAYDACVAAREAYQAAAQRVAS